MKLSEFILLNEEEKKFSLLHEGVLIAKRKDGNCLVLLFQLENYYVETFCNRANKQIEEYRAFNDTNTLHPYLNLISIEGLVH